MLLAAWWLWLGQLRWSREGKQTETGWREIMLWNSRNNEYRHLFQEHKIFFQEDETSCWLEEDLEPRERFYEERREIIRGWRCSKETGSCWSKVLGQQEGIASRTTGSENWELERNTLSSALRGKKLTMDDKFEVDGEGGWKLKYFILNGLIFWGSRIKFMVLWVWGMS